MEADMACPVDGSEYIKVGENRICPKCGHVAGYKQMDIVKLLQDNESLKQQNEHLKDVAVAMNNAFRDLEKELYRTRNWSDKIIKNINSEEAHNGNRTD